MPLQVLNGPVIEAGESLSEGLDCSGGQLIRITMPPGDWDGDAVLTFQFSSDGVMYNDMFGLDGFEATLKVVVPGSGVIIPSDIGRAIAWIKFRSGTRGDPVTQNDRKQFAVTILTEDVETPPASRSASKRKPQKQRFRFLEDAKAKNKKKKSKR